MRHRRLAALATAALTAFGLAAPVGAVPAGAAPHDRLPAVHPTPQSIHDDRPAAPLGDTVALVTGSGSDPAAVRLVRRILRRAHVRRVDATTDPARVPRGRTAVYVGGPAKDPVTAGALRALGADDADALPAEGYVLAAGRARGRSLVVLDGHDATGTFYAAQTLRQLVRTRQHRSTVPGVTVRDWPSYPVRGVIEGFYGTPWSHAARLDQLDFSGAHKMDTYVYSPKDDPYLRDKWRSPYPPDRLDRLAELVDRAKADHVRFTYALSPGLSVCYSSDADEQALVDKFQSLWDIGVRDFAVPLDDISYTTWNCDADKAKFGTGGAAAGRAQSFLLNRVQADFVDTHDGAARLQMVPTEYSDTSASPYKSQLKSTLDPAIVVEWTGVGVIASTITAAQAADARSVFGHDILLWDNYPVNDYVTQRLLLGPYVGRAAGMSDSLYGITANPMIQPEASKIALFTVADFTWNDTAYDPRTSWRAGLAELAGGDRRARRALGAFADLEHYSRLDRTQAPALAARLDRFWPAWESGHGRAAGTLDDYLRTIETIPDVLRSRMHDPAFVADTRPWLDAAGTWGGAARAALRMLVDQRAGRGAAAQHDRRRVHTLVDKARSYRYVGMRGTVDVLVGDGVLDDFIDDALAENDRWLGLSGTGPAGTTSMPTYQDNAPANMVDGDDSTFFWSSRAPSPGDWVGVDLGAVREIHQVSVHMGKSGSRDDYVHAGTVEYSADGSTWTSAATVADTSDVRVVLPAGTTARYVRLRDTGTQRNWVVVREFEVTGPDSQRPTVSGTPAASAGTSLAAAADGDADTAYTAARAPRAGDALTVTLPRPRPLRRVGIVASGAGDVQVRSDDGWRTLGRLRAGYTELSAHGDSVHAIRLRWRAGRAAPVVREVVPWYADTTAGRLSVEPSMVDMSVGGSATVTLRVAATRPGRTVGTVRVRAPGPVTVRPGTERVRLARGGLRTIRLTLGAGRPGTYRVPVSFTPVHGHAVRQTLTVRVRAQDG